MSLLKFKNGLLLGTAIEGAEGAQGGGGVDPAAAAAGGAAPWYGTPDAETVGFLQNRGWDKLPADQAALQAVKSYREAEKHIGAPPDQLLRMPKDAADAEGWKRVYAKLGVPETKDKYDFTGITLADKTPLADKYVGPLRDLSEVLHLNTDSAKALAQGVAKLFDADKAADQAEYDVKLSGEKDVLKKNWGANAGANKIVAENAALKLGVTAEELASLEKTVGYARTMEMFRNIGARIGEDQFVRSDGPAGGVMTREQAEATLKSLENDQLWVAKFNQNDTATVQQWHNLTKLISGVS